MTHEANMPETPRLQVAAKAAIINDTGHVLLLQEASSGQNNTQIGKWGLIGGRLEPGEPFLTALHREIAEESGLTVKPLHPLYIGEWRPLIQGVPHHIVAFFMLCQALTNDVTLSTEHANFAWVDPTQRHSYDMMDPDDLVIDAIKDSYSRVAR